ncbi:MAG: hypothetical protein A2X86_17775 [Bdellovibrionales bacterium GWA2_49_15]|nr:MAG: hypothetical protein A2X86_17775 [Bdellovibrionales bacterium GWA2_49_15]HAZ14980.1 hypothetical protein [Bdellovibrionales bacterium]
MSNSKASKVLVTTPDYFPKLGGLSSFTRNIETTLTQLGIPYQLYIWQSFQELMLNPIRTEGYKAVINIHFLGAMASQTTQIPVLTFFHGSEILFYSPNIFKRIIKIIQKNKILRKIEQNTLNIFISEFTLNKIKALGLQEDIARDLVVHNGIDCQDAQLISKNLDEGPLTLICVARDVPHKNLEGAVILARNLFKVAKCPIKLMLTADRQWPAIEGVEIISLRRPTPAILKDLVAHAHFNLLLSLDHSTQGYFEGFGLSALEAGMFGTPTLAFPTGGLPENIHHGLNGYLIPSDNLVDVTFWYEQLNKENYEKLRKSTYKHTVENHSLKVYEKIFSNWQDLK